MSGSMDAQISSVKPLVSTCTVLDVRVFELL
jgi:hypothetical protein